MLPLQSIRCLGRPYQRQPPMAVTRSPSRDAIVIHSLARLIAAVLIAASAAAFATGVALERHPEAAEHAADRPSPGPPTPTPATGQGRAEATPLPTAHHSGQDADHGGGTDEGHHSSDTTTAPAARAPAATAPATSAPAATTTPGAAAGTDGGDADGGHDGGPATAAEEQGHPELLFGINLESTGLVTAAVVASVLFAVAILIISMPWLAAMIAAAMLAFAALDIKEIVHQLGESHTELAAVAAVAAVLHLLAALAAARVARSGTSTAAAQP